MSIQIGDYVKTIIDYSRYDNFDAFSYPKVNEVLKVVNVRPHSNRAVSHINVLSFEGYSHLIPQCEMDIYETLNFIKTKKPFKFF